MLDTVPITPSRRQLDRGARLIGRARLSIVLPGLLGACLVILSGPRIWLEANLLGARETLARLEAGDGAGAGTDAWPFAERLERLAVNSESPRAYAMAARAWIANAERTDAAAARRKEAIDHARSMQAAGLARAPADQFGWQRLAHILAVQNQWIGAAQAWRLAVVTGPFEPSIMQVKFKSGLALWRYMDLPERATFADLTETYLRSQPEALVATVRAFDAVPIVRQALAGRDTGPAFERALDLWPPRP
jgi:hypothetical protein